MLTLLENCNSTIVTEELKLIKTIDKINYVTAGNDGFINKSGGAVIYGLTGGTDVNVSSVGATNTFQELLQDFLKIRSDLNKFNDELYNYKIIPSGDTETYNDSFIFNSYISNLSEPTNVSDGAENRFFMLFGKDILTNADGFSNNIIDVALKNEEQQTREDWKSYFNITFYKENTGLIPTYNNSKTIVDNRFKSFNDNFYNQTYNTYNPYNKDKTRIMLYSTIVSPTDDQQNNLKDINNNTNSLWDKFNLKVSFN
jgi:hypothetical protein